MTFGSLLLLRRPRTGYRMPNNIQWVEEMVEEYGESRFLRALEELENES